MLFEHFIFLIIADGDFLMFVNALQEASRGDFWNVTYEFTVLQVHDACRRLPSQRKSKC